MSIQLLPDDVEDMFLHELSPASLFKYGRTNRINNKAVQSYVERRFRINDLLGRYFSPSEIDRLRQLQAATGAVISGSTALQFFGRVVYPESDLDVYMDYMRCEELGVWLLSIGYQYAPPAGKSDSTTFCEDVKERCENIEQFSEDDFIEPGPDGEAYLPRFVFNFEKKPDRKVQLIVSIHSPLESILNFHSTCTMNFITHDTAYSLFPRGTFEDRLALSLPNRKSNSQSALAKYRCRGWDIRDTICLDEYVDVDNATFPFKQGMRYVGDAYCWSMPVLPKVAFTARPYNIASNSWLVKYDEQRSLTLLYKTVKFHRLQFKYIISSDLEDNGLQEILEDSLREGIEYHHSNSDDEEKPLDDVFTDIMRQYRLWRHVASLEAVISDYTSASGV